jgi:3-phytase/alkaline phosphatase D
MSNHVRGRAALVLLLVFAALLFSLVGATADTGRQTVASIESLGLVTFDTGFMYADTEVGGLSGITYDASRGVYYALSDDRSQTNPARFYTVDIDVSDGSLDDGDVTFMDVTYLRDHKGNLFAPRAVDPEGINMARSGQLFISTEGDSDASPPIDPFVNRFNLPGKQNRALPIPDKFLPDGAETFGVRDNLAFESLTSMPNSKHLIAATENALHQDGPPSTLSDASPSRLLEIDASKKRAGAEYVYVVSPIPKDSVPPGIFADNGLVELQALDNHGTYLAMERSFAVGVGNTVVLYEISSEGATDVSGLDALSGAVYTPMSKELVADFELDLGVDPDNLEGMTFGPTLPDGRTLLIVVSDNNFNPSQTTQFVALAVTLETAP